MQTFRRVDAARRAAAILLLAGALAATTPTQADEGGVSYWLPGQQGSLAAAPLAPGVSLPVVYYHTSVGANASKTFQIGGVLVADLDADADLLVMAPTFVASQPVLGGQLAVGLTALAGDMRVKAGISLTGPGGNPIMLERRDSVFGVGDLYPQVSLRWNRGTSNYMVYTQVGVPVGTYKQGRLANLGTNHWSIDMGGGYTYFNPQNGREFSAVAGVTYNFENAATQYRNGADFHLDWGASQFLSQQLHVGIVGYFYQQFTGDRGEGATLGDFKSRVAGVGPQIGYIFPMFGRQAYFNVKGYYEFAAENRMEGWNGWITLAIPLTTPKMGAAPAQ